MSPFQDLIKILSLLVELTLLICDKIEDEEVDGGTHVDVVLAANL